jgi:hypothetical protein
MTGNLIFDFKNGCEHPSISPSRKVWKDFHLKRTGLVCDPHKAARNAPSPFLRANSRSDLTLVADVVLGRAAFTSNLG